MDFVIVYISHSKLWSCIYNFLRCLRCIFLKIFNEFLCQDLYGGIIFLFVPIFLNKILYIHTFFGDRISLGTFGTLLGMLKLKMGRLSNSALSN